jgi:hypothetical protein
MAALAAALSLPWLLTHCAARVPPSPAPTPTCYPRPEATGEKYIPATIEPSSPLQAAPGEAIAIHITGGYLIVNNAIVCGEGNVTGYVHADRLPGFTWDRTVLARLDGLEISRTTCGYTCRAEIVIPAGASPGVHQLEVRAGAGMATFAIQITTS